MTETLADRIERHEGFEPYPKADNRFKGTSLVIGFGHDITPQQAAGQYANGVGYGEALSILEADIANCATEAQNRLPFYENLSPVRQDVVLEMIFQLGIDGVLKFHDMIAALEAGDWAEAAKQMTNSQWHAQTPARCEELAALMAAGQ
jgi:lysozyme